MVGNDGIVAILDANGNPITSTDEGDDTRALDVHLHGGLIINHDLNFHDDVVAPIPESDDILVYSSTGWKSVEPGTFCMTAGRNAENTTNLYLRQGNATPTNLTPFILPWDCTLIAIAAATNGNETWIAEIHKSLVLVSDATLSIVTSDKGYVIKSIDFNAGDEISMYCNGISIDRPRISVFYKRRY